MAESESISPLRSVNGYEILELIAAGGMSRVYRARNAAGDPVAVKVIQFDEMAADYERRLRREPEIQRGIGHDNIVRLLDWFRVGGEFFLVMEHIDGRSLWRIIHEDGRLRFERARDYLRQALPAVGHLHELGIIHRDIKPANILVAADDSVKLADFGIAKFTWQQGQTRTQLGLGTPEYMSPEQARGVGIDHRTDIYSLGITFFEMLTGAPPFARQQATPAAYSEIIQGILSQTVPDPRTIVPELPEAAAALIARATAKEPKDRFASVAQMLRALDAIDAGDRSPATVVPPPVDEGAGRPFAGNEGDGSSAASASDAAAHRLPMPATGLGGRPAAPARRKRIWGMVAIVLSAVAAATFAATQLYDDQAPATPLLERPRETPAEVAARTASRYGALSLAHGIEPLAALYATTGVAYFGDSLSRDSIVAELREDYRTLARTDSFRVDVDSVRALGDTAIDLVWRTRYARVRTDSSRFAGGTRDELRLVRAGDAWLIAAHDRRLVAGIAPDGPIPVRRVATPADPAQRSASRSTSRSPARSTAQRGPASRPSGAARSAPTRPEPTITVTIGRGVKLEVDRKSKGSDDRGSDDKRGGKGNERKAKKRRD